MADISNISPNVCDRFNNIVEANHNSNDCHYHYHRDIVSNIDPYLNCMVI